MPRGWSRGGDQTMRTCVATMVDAGQANEGRIGLEDVDIPRLGMAAMRFIQAIEQGHHGVLWDAASDAIRQSITRDAFIHSLAHRHDVLGRGTGRRWTAVRVGRPATRADQLTGTYAMLEFSVSFGGRGTPHREVITLRREESGIWRLAGYGVNAT